jgi:hypothetical protein
LKKLFLDDTHTKKFENYVLSLSTDEIANMLEELLINDVELFQKKSNTKQNLKDIKKSFEHSIQHIEAQKKLYHILFTCETLRLPIYQGNVSEEVPGHPDKYSNIPLHSKHYRLQKFQTEEQNRNLDC